MVELDAPSSSWAVADISQLKSRTDQLCARRSLVFLSQHARSGLPLEQLYDEKQCHLAFDFNYNQLTYKVHRIRGAATRIYFIYRPNKVIIIVAISAKRENKLTAGEINHISSRVIRVIDRLDAVEKIVGVLGV